MQTPLLTAEQEGIIEAPMSGCIFLQGTAGTGKTTAAVNRYLRLIQSGIPAESILVLVPQRTLGYAYYKAVHQVQDVAGGIPDILTFGGLARRMIDLFWPVIGGQAGFSSPESPPLFLTMETAQYYLSKIIRPMLDQGMFETARLDINRLASQVLDNLNKAAVVGFDHRTVGEKLQVAWVGKPDQLRLYEDTQEAAILFRQYCLQHNLLDFSLQYEIFAHHLWQMDSCRNYLFNRYHHLIYDNIEEDVPLTHDLVRDWQPFFDSALMVYDLDGGFRAFLGADPLSGNRFKDTCQSVVHFTDSFVNTPGQTALIEILGDTIQHNPIDQTAPGSLPANLDSMMQLTYVKFLPELINTICEEIRRLIQGEGIPPGEIVVLSPYLSDALRFAISNRLAMDRIPMRSFRPSRSLVDEPAVRCLLTLVKMAHPSWEMTPSRFDIRYALIQAIEGLDLVRADLLAQIVFRKNIPPTLSSFDQIQTEKQDRITFIIGERFEILRRWLLAYMDGDPDPLDVFITRLFGEVLSQPGFGFHVDFDAADAAARLVESVQKFRKGTSAGEIDIHSLGTEYLRTLSGGVLAAQSPQSWTFLEEDAVLVTPAYTYLMSNHPARVQFWLDIGSLGWWERLNQPLTHPYVLSRHWHPEAKWTDVQEYQHNQAALVRLVSGLIRRSTGKIYLCAVGVDEQGREGRGPLLRAMQTLKRRLSPVNS